MNAIERYKHVTEFLEELGVVDATSQHLRNLTIGSTQTPGNLRCDYTFVSAFVKLAHLRMTCGGEIGIYKLRHHE